MQTTGADHYSGLLVITLPGRLDDTIEALEGRAGITVSIRDPDGIRMIVVLEAASRDHLEELHQQVTSLPGVVTALPVVHYVDDPSRDPVCCNGSDREDKESACSRP